MPDLRRTKAKPAVTPSRDAGANKISGPVHRAKLRKLRRISQEIDAALENETVHGYTGGPELIDQAWLRDELAAGWGER
jgi:hypothetical protein